MIKNVKPSGHFKSGEYNPIAPEKYKGKMPIIYRSSWEKMFCIFCDTNEQIITWSSEELEIPYLSQLDKKWHRYYPDFYLEIKKGDKVVKYVVEVKPLGDLIKPTKPKRLTEQAKKNYNWKAKTFYINKVKKQFAEEYCRKRGWKFVYVTEKWNSRFKK